jgi:predicted metal-dependent hydrolase
MPVGEAHRRRDARRAAEGQCRRPALARLRLRDIFGGGPQRDGSPRAEREPRRVALAGVDVEYVLVRVRRRSIGMEIGLSGLTVRAPRRVSVREIEATLAERAVWILRSLAEWKARRRDVLPREWKTGAPILYRGSELALAVHAARTPSIAPDLFHLNVLHPRPDDEPAIATTVGRWLKDQALATVVPRVAAYAARLGAGVPPLGLSNARREWGSCNHKGEIRLSWRLVQLPPDLADYVIAHEVAHLVELNHSARFWAVVERLFPDHAAARRALGDWTAVLEA